MVLEIDGKQEDKYGRILQSVGYQDKEMKREGKWRIREVIDDVRGILGYLENQEELRVENVLERNSIVLV